MEFQNELITARTIFESDGKMKKSAAEGTKFCDRYALTQTYDVYDGYSMEIEEITPTNEEGVYETVGVSVKLGYMRERLADPTSFLKRLSQISVLDFATIYCDADNNTDVALHFADLYERGEL